MELIGKAFFVQERRVKAVRCDSSCKNKKKVEQNFLFSDRKEIT